MDGIRRLDQSMPGLPPQDAEDQERDARAVMIGHQVCRNDGGGFGRSIRVSRLGDPIGPTYTPPT